MIAAFARAGAHAGSARTAEAGAVPRGRRRAAAFIRSGVERRIADAAAPLSRRRRRHRGYAEDYAYLIFGLLELFQADPRPGWLSGRSRCSGGRTSCSGTTRRRMVQHDRPRSERAASHERGLRRRGADRELGVGAEPAGAVAPRRRLDMERAHRADAASVRDAARADGPRRADDGGGALHLRRRRSTDRPGRRRRRRQPRSRAGLPLPAVCDRAAGHQRNAACACRQPAVRRRDARGRRQRPPMCAATLPAVSRSLPSTRCNRSWGPPHERVRRHLAARHRPRHHRHDRKHPACAELLGGRRRPARARGDASGDGSAEAARRSRPRSSRCAASAGSSTRTKTAAS